VHIIVFLLGLFIALSTLFLAIKQAVLPGRKKVRLSRTVARTTFLLFRFAFVRVPSEQVRDALWAFYAPMSVMLLPLVWVILLMFGFAMMFWEVSEPSPGTALSLGGAALTTEGFLAPKGGAQTTLYIIAGIIGLGIVAHCLTKNLPLSSSENRIHSKYFPTLHQDHLLAHAPLQNARKLRTWVH
jgi:hypothetical protein